MQIKRAPRFLLDCVAMDTAALIGAALAHCSHAIDAQRGALASLFLAGLLSGVTHCAGMCGPFVLAQAGSRFAALPVADLTWPRRLAGAAAVPYQLGRITTYGLLGTLVAGGFGRLLPAQMPAIGAMALIAVAMLFLLHGLGRLQFAGFPWSSGLAGIAGPLLDRPFGWRGYLVGMALGLLPCGMIYAALAVAATTGDMLSGGLAMLAFALGTVPGLVAVGWLGHGALTRWRWPLRHLPAILLLTNAGVLLAMAMRLTG